jgi:uncharacterized protein (DUF697 family)
MTRKQLPKAITRTREDLRDIAAGPVADEAAPAPQSVLPHDAVAAEPAPAPVPAPAVSAQPIARVLLPATSIRAEPYAVRRRSLARKIVERHKTYAAVGGLLPLPIVNIASVTAIILRMVKQLSDLYAVPFARDRTRSIVIGLMGGAVPTGLGAATTSTLAFVIPGPGFVGLVVSAITAGALTRGIGLVFVEHFESEAMSLRLAETKHA